jgi:hypothetical protein
MVLNGTARAIETSLVETGYDPAVFEELSPKKGRDSPTAKGRQVPCRNSIDSSANSAVNGRDCARAAVQEGVLSGMLSISDEKEDGEDEG